MQALADAVAGAKCVAAMTGAGVSTLCGIPDFRGPKGLYRNPDAERIFDIGWFDRDPSVYYRGCRDLIYGLDAFSPGPVHVALKRLEDAGVVFSEDERARAGYAVFLKEGENPLPGERFLFLSRDARTVEEYTGKYGVLHTSVSQTTLDGRMIEGGMYCRPVKAGDRVYFGGMTRRVAELIRVRVKDTAARREYPLLCDEKGVLWVPGCPPREERAKAAGGSANGDKIYICLVNGGAQNEEKHQG